MLRLAQCPGELGERDGFTLEVGTGAEQYGGVKIDRRVGLTHEGIVGFDAMVNLDNEVVKRGLVRKDDGV